MERVGSKKCKKASPTPLQKGSIAFSSNHSWQNKGKREDRQRGKMRNCNGSNIVNEREKKKRAGMNHLIYFNFIRKGLQSLHFYFFTELYRLFLFCCRERREKLGNRFR